MYLEVQTKILKGIPVVVSGTLNKAEHGEGNVPYMDDIKIYWLKNNREIPYELEQKITQKEYSRILQELRGTTDGFK